MLTDNPAVPLLLVIEDDDNDAFLILQAFQDAPTEYHLKMVSSFKDAWQVIELHPPDLILTNHVLPDGDGNELLAMVNGACPVILMASDGNEQVAVSALKRGAQDYIAKSPDTFSSLPQVVMMALQEWHRLEDRRKINAAVSRGKREWEQTFDAVPDMILIIDTDHTISRVNRAMAARCGLPPTEMPGRKCYELFHNTSSPPPFCPYVRLIKDGREQTEEVEESALAGSFDITVSPLFNGAGSLTACVHVARDITDRKKAEEERLAIEQQFQQANKLESLGVLAGGIAHDFNNILTIILGHCMLAKKDEKTEASDICHLDQIEIAAHRAADLCRQMSNYAGKNVLVQTPVDMRLLVDDTIKMLKSAIKKNVTLKHESKRDALEITCDKTKIQQIIMNLIVNAVEAIGNNNGMVRVGLATVVQPGQGETDFLGHPIAEGSYACLEVSDTGCGMDVETQKRMFEPFFTTKFTGRGLGMSAVIGIIKSHKGALQVSSKPGEGTTFKVYFPLTPKPDPAKTTQAPRSDSSANCNSGHGVSGTILLVDDEKELRRIGTDMLVAMGFSVITACNGREALDIFSERGSTIDLVFMDLTMPEMDGIKAYGELRKITSIPIVLCSGYGSDEISSYINHDVHADFMPKPYRSNQVREVMTRLLDNRLSHPDQV